MLHVANCRKYVDRSELTLQSDHFEKEAQRVASPMVQLHNIANWLFRRCHVFLYHLQSIPVVNFGRSSPKCPQKRLQLLRQRSRWRSSLLLYYSVLNVKNHVIASCSTNYKCGWGWSEHMAHARSIEYVTVVMGKSPITLPVTSLMNTKRLQETLQQDEAGKG